MDRSVSDHLRTFFKGGSFLILGFVIEMGIGFFAKVIAAQFLVRADYGAVSLGITILGILSSFTLLGLNSGVSRYLSRDDNPAYRRGVILSALHIVLILSLIVGIVIIVFAHLIATRIFNDPSATTVLRVFGATIPIAALAKLSVSGTQGAQQTLPKVYIDKITKPIVRFSGIVVAIVLGFGAVGVSVAYLFSYLAAAILGGYFLNKATPLLEGITPEYRYSELLRFSLPLLIAGMAGMIYADLDILIIGALAGTEPVADYNVVYPLSQLVTIFLVGFSFLFTPVFSELHASGETSKMRRIYPVVTKWIVLGTLPVFLVMFSFPTLIIQYSFGVKYATAGPALSILSLAFLTTATLGPNIDSLTSIGETKKIMRVNVVMAVLNIVLNLILIPPFSYYGAAVATAITYVSMNFAMSWYLYRITNIVPLSRNSITLGIIILFEYALVYSTIILIFGRSLLALIILGFVFGPIYIWSIVRFGGIEEEEIMILNAAEDKFGIDLGPVKRIAVRLME